jgi:hypothetical protein
MFMFGYGYVASLVATEQFARQRAVAVTPAMDSVPPPAMSAADLSSEELAAE